MKKKNNMDSENEIFSFTIFFFHNHN
jgi:hypothetical protein